MELAVGRLYLHRSRVYAMDSFDPEEARRKTEQGYFVIAGGGGLDSARGGCVVSMLRTHRRSISDSALAARS